MRTTGRGVRLPAAFAAPTSDPEHEERCEDEATHPVAQGAARFLLFSLEGGPMINKIKTPYTVCDKTSSIVFKNH